MQSKHDWQKTPQPTRAKALDVKATLAKMWLYRHGGDLIASTELFTEIAAHFGLNLAETASHQASRLRERGVSSVDIIDFLLFRPAQLRFGHQRALAVTATEDVAVIAEELGCPQHVQLLIQRGINRLVQSNFGAALNEFTLAFRRTRCASEHLICLFNQLICLESMAYDYSEKLKELDSFWRTYPDKSEPLAKAARSQMIALQLRQSLAEGDLGTLARVIETTDVDRQGAYYASFLCRLPYWNWVKPESVARLDRQLESTSLAFESQFRIGTLQGRLLRDDFDDNHRFGDKIERLYLWVWMWLIHPDPEQLDRVILWWEHIMANSANAQVGRDELPLLRNAARWLGLFAGYDDVLIRRRMAILSPANIRVASVFDYESHLIDLCIAWRDRSRSMAEDEKKNLLNHAANHLPGFTLPNAVKHSIETFLSSQNSPESPADSTLETFVNRLLTFTPTKDFAPVDPGIYVEPLRQRVTVVLANNSRKVIENESLVLLLIAASHRDAVPIYEILERCFDIKSYDPTIHDSKLAHLLVAANRDFNHFLTFKRKKTQIIIERTDASPQSSIRFLGAGQHIIQMAELRERFLVWIRPQIETWNDSVSNKATGQDSTPREHIVAGTWITRQQLEIVLQVSRATVCRRLSHWINEGLVDKRGEGRATEYRPTPALSIMLKSTRGRQNHV